MSAKGVAQHGIKKSFTTALSMATMGGMLYPYLSNVDSPGTRNAFVAGNTLKRSLGGKNLLLTDDIDVLFGMAQFGLFLAFFQGWEAVLPARESMISGAAS